MATVRDWFVWFCIMISPVGLYGSGTGVDRIELPVALSYNSFSDSIPAEPTTMVKVVQGFGFGPIVTTVFSGGVDQIFFPGFTISSSRHNNEVLFDLRGRFFFGDLDGYHLELAGYRFVSQTNPLVYLGGGIGFGGMNLKENMVFDINGIPVPGVFYQNGNGMHAFLGIGTWLKQTGCCHFRGDLDYYLSLYNIGNIQSPTGFRIACSVFLHPGWN